MRFTVSINDAYAAKQEYIECDDIHELYAYYTFPRLREFITHDSTYFIEYLTPLGLPDETRIVFAALILDISLLPEDYTLDEWITTAEEHPEFFRMLFDWYFTAGEGIQSGTPGKEWETIRITEYQEPVFRSINREENTLEP